VAILRKVETMTDENPSGRPYEFRGKRGPERSERRKAAEAAGMSRHQMYQALKLANIPEDEFERLVESDHQPTVTELAAYGGPPTTRQTSSPRRKAAAAIAKALDAVHSAYWTACDAEGRAIDPADLDAPDGLLNDAFDAALRVQAIAAERGLSWHAAREFV